MYPDLKPEMERFNNNIVDLMIPFKNRDYYTKDMQKQSGILITSFWYNPQKREDDELILEENLDNDIRVSEINEEKKNEMNEKKEKTCGIREILPQQ